MKIMDFSPANCKNCYKCVRNCQVKAIKIVNDQATIDEERCIACGECFVVCPQNARNIVSDVSWLKEAISKGEQVVASIAPSCHGLYKDPEVIVAALFQLGFNRVEETGIGAEMVTRMYEGYATEKDHVNLITTCCPSVNLLVEKYYPSLVPYLIPIQSPMLVHANLIREGSQNEPLIAFIGPCIAKKSEAKEDAKEKNNHKRQAVISFDEMENWFSEARINLEQIEPKPFSKIASGIGRQYPVENGILSGLSTNVTNQYFPMKVSGIGACKELFQAMVLGEINHVIVEANVCIGGCIGGPARAGQQANLQIAYIRLKKKVVQSPLFRLDSYKINKEAFEKSFKAKEFAAKRPTSEEVCEILNKIGKTTPEDELNCGACGYDTCKEKAIAVYQGMSHKEMCIPNMRTRAERLIDTIFYHSPNIIIILDEQLNVLEFNPTAEKIFLISAEEMVNRPINYLINDEDFRHVQSTKENIYAKKIICHKYHLMAQCNIIYLPKQHLYLTIMHNQTEELKKGQELLELRESTLEVAQNVINKQMRVAQEIASLLGETTAETKVTLTKLQKIIRGEAGDWR